MTGGNGGAVVEIVGVRKVFRGDVAKTPEVAIEDLSLTFPRGKTTGLLGHNGAGKTTTIRLILGLIRPDKGDVRFEGRPLVTSDKRRIGYMPETNKLAANLTPEEILHHALTVHAPAWATSAADRRRAVDAKLQEVGLSGHRRKRAGKLSKGMGRRLAWAQATLHRPALLILDEPTSGLDPLARRDMLRLIEEAKSADTTVVLCTHELGQVSTLCDGYHVLRKGRLVHSANVLGHGEKAAGGGGYVIQLSGADAPALARVGEDAKLRPWLGMRREGFLTTLRFGDYASATGWLQALLRHGFVVLRFGDEGLTLEDELIPHYEKEV